MQKFIQIELWENLQKHPWDKMTTHLTSGIISALITTLGGVTWNRLWDGDSQAEGLCSVINNLVERRKQNRLSKGDTWTVDTVSLLTGFHKKSSPDLPELDALPSYFPWGIRVCLYPHPHWPGFRNKLPRTGVHVILGQAALISWGNSWGLTFPTVGEIPASDVKHAPHPPRVSLLSTPLVLTLLYLPHPLAPRLKDSVLVAVPSSSFTPGF